LVSNVAHLVANALFQDYLASRQSGGLQQQGNNMSQFLAACGLLRKNGARTQDTLAP